MTRGALSLISIILFLGAAGLVATLLSRAKKVQRGSDPAQLTGAIFVFLLAGYMFFAGSLDLLTRRTDLGILQLFVGVSIALLGISMLRSSRG
jgi:O-antigen ligase